ncbi:DUF3570 domain-containing protein [Mucilaginibacter sp.]|uniref:DUF3570 domain-containing protein n=1 Tax=Mucilaginibacter sp. TaxID=1882438 RepID=UPI0028416E95|nr:DUF3570 domain-containing protein [Mucilaginibacter sp.]MDR3696856.1 DUF3570 domain-containing protein [Mucilaginibacter sp.]
MKKKFLSVIGFAILCRFQVYAQVKTDTATLPRPAYTSLYTPVDQDSTSYNARQLRIDEIDLVSSYYSQTGDRSAVMGGMPGPKGTQNVTDLSNGLNLNLVWLNQANNKNTLSIGLGYDHHTSASAGYVALNGGAKTGGTRFYPSLDWTVENAKTGGTFGIGAYYSGEYNYKSKGIDFHWSTKTTDKSGEFGVKLQGYFDNVTLIYPSELIPPAAVTQPGNTVYTTASGQTVILSSSGQVVSNSKNSLPTSARTTLTASFSYSQQINSRLQVMFLGDVVTQSGYLGLPFHRVYFTTGDTAKVEKLPSSRFKLPLGFRLNYFLGDNIILRTYYRYYMDNWGTRSNTASIEVPYKVTPFFSISPFYRYYDQTASKYYAAYRVHSVTDAYYTSNDEYSKFNAGFYGVGFRIAPPNGVFGMHSFHEMEIRYGHYTQTTNLASDVVSLSMGFK